MVEAVAVAVATAKVEAVVAVAVEAMVEAMVEAVVEAMAKVVVEANKAMANRAVVGSVGLTIHCWEAVGCSFAADFRFGHSGYQSEG